MLNEMILKHAVRRALPKRNVYFEQLEASSFDSSASRPKLAGCSESNDVVNLIAFPDRHTSL